MQKILLTIVFIITTTVSVMGQSYEPVYSQYWTNGLAINPAYAGSRECFSNIIMYRNQWMGFDGAPITQTLSSHAPFKDEKNAVGLFLFHESIGVTDYFDIFANYAFRFKLGDGKIALGLRVGATYFQGDYSDVNPNPEGFGNDPIWQNESEIFPNAGVGVYYYSDKFFAGFSVPKLLTNEMQVNPENYDFLLTGGYIFKFSELLKLRPVFLMRYRLNNTLQFDAGANLIFYDLVWVGGSYRADDEYVFMLEYQVNQQIRVGAAYEYSAGKFSGQQDGSFELVLRYDFSYKMRAVSPRYF